MFSACLLRAFIQYARGRYGMDGSERNGFMLERNGNAQCAENNFNECASHSVCMRVRVDDEWSTGICLML